MTAATDTTLPPAHLLTLDGLPRAQLVALLDRAATDGIAAH